MDNDIALLRKKMAAIKEQMADYREQMRAIERQHLKNDTRMAKEIFKVYQRIRDINESLWPLVHKVIPEWSPGADKIAALLDRRKQPDT